MRYLIVAASVLACAIAAPSGLYGQGLLAHGAPLGFGHGAGLGYSASLGLGHASPTISSGDIDAAAIDAQVTAADHARANYDAAREYQDQAAELQGQAVDAAEDHTWLALDAAQAAYAERDGAAAAAAPVIAHQLAGNGAHGFATPLGAHGYAAAPIAAHGIAAPFGGNGIAGHAGSHSVATQSLTQTHPAPSAYAHQGAGHGFTAPLISNHGYAAPFAGHGVSAPLAGHSSLSQGHAGSHSVATQSLTQTHPAPSAYVHRGAAHGFAAPLIANHGSAAPLTGHGSLSHGHAGSHSVATQSLSQTHPAPNALGHHGYGQGLSHGLAW